MPATMYSMYTVTNSTDMVTNRRQTHAHAKS
ncbi:Uncharacterised protein [Mycobacteroides abscessus subsp. abscessus]|nr:Uncharacterised protein [Mycobacteroides abscessus subsp. abscessus]